MVKRGKFNIAPKRDRTLRGEVFDSKTELDFFKHLEFLKRATLPSERVVDIQKQVKYPLVVNNFKVCDYILDFMVTYADGSIYHYDVKGYTRGATYAVFRLKAKLMQAVYDIKVVEVKKSGSSWTYKF
jgi:hypothetical protein